MKRNLIFLFAAVAGAGLVAGCYTAPSVAAFAAAGAVELRSFQTRAFDTTDRDQTLRTVIATLQDLGFVIDRADAALGTVGGTKLAGYQMRMTVMVRPRGAKQLLVRASAQYQKAPYAAPQSVEEPAPYQAFFAALEKAMFLTAQQAD
jgi:hypothetical protein